MSCCAGGTNGCIDLICRAFAISRQVSTEWSRCPGSMARRVALLRWSSAGWMPARIGRWSAGVGRRHGQWHSITDRNASLLMTGSMGRMWGCEHAGASTLLLNGLGLMWMFATLLPQHSCPSQQAASRVLRVISAFYEVTSRCPRRYVRDFFQRYSEVFGLGAKGQGFVVVVDFRLTFSFLVVEMEDRRHRFRSAEL